MSEDVIVILAVLFVILSVGFVCCRSRYGSNIDCEFQHTAGLFRSDRHPRR